MSVVSRSPDLEQGGAEKQDTYGYFEELVGIKLVF